MAAVFPSDAAVNEALRGVRNTTQAVRRMGGLPDKALHQPRAPEPLLLPLRLPAPAGGDRGRDPGDEQDILRMLAEVTGGPA